MQERLLNHKIKNVEIWGLKLRQLAVGTLNFLLALMVVSCASRNVEMTENVYPTRDIKISDIELYPGDEIEIKFAYAPEFNETQTIRVDGKIELLLVGEVLVEGKSPSMVRKELIELYSKHLSHPDLAVMLRASYNNRIYVGGAVNSPGVLELMGRMSILDAVIETGGFDLDTAKMGNVLLIRLNNGRRYVYDIDVKSYISGEKLNFVYLQPMDIIYVPRTKITNMANFMDNLWTIIPFRFSMSYVMEYEDIKKLWD